MPDIQKTITALEKNGMDPFFLESKEALLPLLRKLMPEGATVGVGGSETLFECGVIDFLRENNYEFFDRYQKGTTPEKLGNIFVRSSDADVYLSSSNAITENGELYNVDGRSNRVSALAHGPKSVIIVAGVNKIVANLSEAVRRVKEIAAPKNCMRLHCDTYCFHNGRCKSLLSPDPDMTDGCGSHARICCNYLISAKQRQKGRIKVILINEDLGY